MFAKFIYEQLENQKESKKWPICQGIITSAYYMRNRPIITYEYVAFGRHYQNQKLKLSLVDTYLNTEKKLQFAPEKFVNVHYNIKNPQISCLFVSNGYETNDLILFGAVASTCLLLSFFSLSRFKKYYKLRFK
jgi:hypothetical protein